LPTASMAVESAERAESAIENAVNIICLLISF
jgi:hypothetical protein